MDRCLIRYLRMLYDFHAYQNAQKANSVHATYLIHGTKAGQGDGDVEMASSAPDHEPLSETVPTAALTLVREENLSCKDDPELHRLLPTI